MSILWWRYNRIAKERKKKIFSEIRRMCLIHKRDSLITFILSTSNFKTSVKFSASKLFFTSRASYLFSRMIFTHKTMLSNFTTSIRPPCISLFNDLHVQWFFIIHISATFIHTSAGRKQNVFHFEENHTIRRQASRMKNKREIHQMRQAESENMLPTCFVDVSFRRKIFYHPKLGQLGLEMGKRKCFWGHNLHKVTCSMEKKEEKEQTFPHWFFF